MTEKKESNIKSADSLIIQTEAEKLGKTLPPKEEPTKIEQESKPDQKIKEEKLEDNEDLYDKDEQESKIDQEEVKETKEEKVEKEEKEEIADDDEVDEYGTKVGKPKLYTEDQVQRMIRQRLANRGNNQNREVVEAAKDFKHDPESEESWEAQLENFIDRTLEKRESKIREREWQQREVEEQTKFETKFTSGMEKYADFKDVVSDKPITNAMMLATRSMKDPAAFIYAACKQQPKELLRIAQIKDPVAQATEIGRLEERMKKARKISSSPKPMTKLSSDSTDDMPQVDIDSRIAQHAKSKIMMRR